MGRAGMVLAGIGLLCQRCAGSCVCLNTSECQATLERLSQCREVDWDRIKAAGRTYKDRVGECGVSGTKVDRGAKHWNKPQRFEGPMSVVLSFSLSLFLECVSELHVAGGEERKGGGESVQLCALSVARVMHYLLGLWRIKEWKQPAYQSHQLNHWHTAAHSTSSVFIEQGLASACLLSKAERELNWRFSAHLHRLFSSFLKSFSPSANIGRFPDHYLLETGAQNALT